MDTLLTRPEFLFESNFDLVKKSNKNIKSIELIRSDSVN